MPNWEYRAAWVWRDHRGTWVVGERNERVVGQGFERMDDRLPLEDFLDRAGRDGWEMVGAVVGRAWQGQGGFLSLSKDYYPSHWLYFKRPRV
jgi:hypothetical protein